MVFTIFTETNRNDLRAKPDIRQTVLGRQLCEYKARHYFEVSGVGRIKPKLGGSVPSYGRGIDLLIPNLHKNEIIHYNHFQSL